MHLAIAALALLLAEAGAAGSPPSKGAPAPPRAAAPAAPSPTLPAFFERWCSDCHDDAVAKGNLDLTALKFLPEDRDNFDRWVKVYDRLAAGEMPPEGKDRPARAELDAVLRDFRGRLSAYEQASFAREGRAARRRLNGYEYEQIVRDLFQAPWLQIKAQLPEDREAFGFNKVGDVLDVSHVLIARYLGAAEYTVKQVASVALERPPTTVTRHYARDQRSLTSFAKKLFTPAVDKKKFPVLDYEAQPDVRTGKAPLTVGPADPATREREAVGLMMSNFVAGFTYQWDTFKAPVAGRYRVRFSGYTIWVGPGPDPKRHHLPNWDAISRGRRSEPVVIYTKGGTSNRRLGAFDLTPDPAVHDLGEVWLMANEQIAPDATRLFRRRGPDPRNPLMEKDGAPAVAFRWMEVEGPIQDEKTTAGYRLLFGDLPLRATKTEPPAPVKTVALTGRLARGEPPKEALAGLKLEVVTRDPRADAERLMRNFLARAYRRPVREEELRTFLGLVEERLAAGRGFFDAMVAGYSAVLASPGFVYVGDRPGRLDDHALATRLSLFLWGTAPDEALRARADRGELARPEILRAETERLLSDPRARRFVDSFLDYWVDARKMNATQPSAALYNDYAFDDALVEAALEETRLFFADLVTRDLPARTLVDSRHTFLNERLAAHYGIPGVSGVAMRRVTLPEGSPRGGLLTQATVLKITANGSTTSPVLRGKWVMERMLGWKPPPPPPVPAVEPDIRGAATIREQLDKHKAHPSCSSCHVRIDPPGFALESFDVFGGWRDRYRSVGEEGQPIPGRGRDGQLFGFRLAKPVDASGQLVDGRKFKDIHDFKRLLLAEEEKVAANLARQLVVYATGAPVRMADRPALEGVLARARERKYGVRTLIHEIVASELFRLQ